MIENDKHFQQMKKLFSDTSSKLFNENSLYIYDKVKWEYLKYEIRKYPVRFSKKLAKDSEIKIADLEIRLIYFEKQ